MHRAPDRHGEQCGCRSRGHLTICSKSHAKPKAEENQRAFTNGRFRMGFALRWPIPEISLSKPPFKIVMKGNGLSAYLISVQFLANRSVTPSSFASPKVSARRSAVLR